MTTEDVARLSVYRSIEKKWAGNRQALWNEFNDPLKTKNEIMNNVPEGIAPDQWDFSVNYRLRDNTQKMCQTNAENRRKQIVPHTDGSKLNFRRRVEMFADTGRRPGRAQLYLATHTKKKDGSYVNEEAKEICEKTQLAVSQSTEDESKISPNDVVDIFMLHSGRVRCLGLGATPSTHFKQTKPRVGGIRILSNDVGCSSFGCQDKYNKFLNTFKAYIIMKEGSIPEQFAGIFGSPPTTPSDAGSN